VQAARIPHNGLPERPIVTLSIGVATGSGPQLVIADLVDRADEWSQLAKSTGRNRVLPEAEVPRQGDVVA
jgi:PleD family two-component response regulator